MLDIATLQRMLRYDPGTGKLYWLPRTPDLVAPGRNGSIVEAQRFNSRYGGKEALAHRTHAGYSAGAISGKYAAAHRVAWALLTGAWPTGQIDHINGDRSDNRAINLRDVTAFENARNACRRRDNSSGRTGVYWYADRQRWHASIRFDNEMHHLGFFDTAEAAAQARATAEVEFGFHPNHGRVA